MLLRENLLLIRFSFLYRWPCFFSLSGHVFNCLSRNFDRACLSMDLFFRLPHLSLIRLSMWRILFLQFGRFSFHCFFHYLPLFYLFSSLGTSFGQQLSLLDSFSIFFKLSLYFLCCFLLVVLDCWKLLCLSFQVNNLVFYSIICGNPLNVLFQQSYFNFPKLFFVW